MTDQDAKRDFIEAYLSRFREKLRRLDALFENSHEEEAWILCVVYLDQLASGRYFDGSDKSKENFCRVLSEHGRDTFFSSIHPTQLLTGLRLLDGRRKSGTVFEDAVSRLMQEFPDQFLDIDTVRDAIRTSSLSMVDQGKANANLWRASVALICYERIRCQAVHGPGVGLPLTFGITAYTGDGGSTINFQRLRAALDNVLSDVEALSYKTNEWFGNPNYK